MSNGTPANTEEKVDQYLKDELSEEELSRFEVLLLEDESLLEEVQIRQQLIDSLQDNASNAQPIANFSDTNRGSVKGGVRQNPSFPEWIKQPYSIAASLLVSVGLILSLQDQSDQFVTPLSDVSSIESRIIFDTLRGDSERVSFNGNPPILITIDLGQVFSGTYNISIVDSQNTEEVANLERIELSEPGRINFLLNTKLEGDYEIITLNANAEIVRTDSIRLTN